MKKHFFFFCGIALAIPFLTSCGLFGESVTKINNLGEFKSLMGNNGDNSKFELTTDIDFEGETLTIDKFEKSHYSFNLDGKNFTISNATIISSYNASLFGKMTYGGNIKNLTFKNITVIGVKPAIIASEATNLELTNITIDESCSVGDGSSNNAGGLIGKTTGDLGSNFLTNCTNNGKVAGLENVGGLIGYGRARVEGCVNNGEITGYGESYVGGIAGYLISSDYHKNNKNYGTVIAVNSIRVGGIAGCFSNETQSKDYTASFESDENYGTIIGAARVGGIVGEAATSIFSNFITGSFGNYLLVTNMKNYGTVKGGQYVGGIVGCSAGNSKSLKEFTITITFCSNLKNEKNNNFIEGEYYVGGIAGSGNFFRNCENAVPIYMRESSDKSLIDTEVVYKSEQCYIGGIVGIAAFVQAAEFTSCKNSGSVQGFMRTGHSSYYRNCASLGGIVGYTNGGTFVNNENSGSLDGKIAVGGIIGAIRAKYKTTLSTQKVTGNMNFYKQSGGIIGYYYSDTDYKQDINISACSFNVQYIAIWESQFGGIVGTTETSNSSKDELFGHITIVNSKATYTYEKRNSAALAINPVVGYNHRSNTGKYCCSVDNYTNTNSTATLIA